MKRLAVYCYYSHSGTVSDNSLAFLRDLKTVCEKVVVIANGSLKSDAFECVADKVFVRENTGYDAGAYKFFFEEKDFKELLDKTDEIILCNSSFYGPFISFKAIFEEMSWSNCDFWGLSSSEKNLVKHIQSYFLVFRKRIISDGVLSNFFKNWILSYDLSYTQVCNVFENGLFAFLNEHNYVWSAYNRNISCDPYVNPYGALAIDKLPILKKKIFTDQFYDRNRVLKAVQFIKENFDYDIDILLDGIKQEYGIVYLKSDLEEKIDLDLKVDIIENNNYVRREQIESFIRKNKSIFIFGTGYDALHIFNSFFFSKNNKRFAGFIDDQKKGECNIINGVYKIINLKEIDKNSAIINAVDFADFAQTKQILDNYPNRISIWKGDYKFDEYTIPITAPISEAYFKYKKNGNFPLIVIDAYNKYHGIIGWKELKNVQKNCIVSDIYNSAGIRINYSKKYLYEIYKYFANKNIKYIPVLNDKKQIKEIIFRGSFSQNQYNKILQFADKVNNISHSFVYGAGKYGKAAFKIFSELEIKIEAFIVSKKEEESEIDGIPIKEISEINFNDAFVFVALKQEYTVQVIPLLEAKKVDYICLADIEANNSPIPNLKNLTNDYFGTCNDIIQKQQQIVFYKRVSYDIIVILKDYDVESFNFFIKSIELQSYEDWNLYIIDYDNKLLSKSNLLIEGNERIQIIDGRTHSFSFLVETSLGNYVILVDSKGLLHPSTLYETTKQILYTPMK